MEEMWFPHFFWEIWPLTGMPPTPMSIDERALKAIAIPNLLGIDALLGTRCFLAEKYQVHKSAAGRIETSRVCMYQYFCFSL